MKFFIDENLSERLAEGMKGFGEDVMHLTDEFLPGVQDEVWIPYVGKHNLVLVTRDRRINYRPREKMALQSNNVGAFFLGGKNRNRCQLIQQLVRNWPRMKELTKNTSKPFGFVVPASGTKITKIF